MAGVEVIGESYDSNKDGEIAEARSPAKQGPWAESVPPNSVSYTHLDVYKRQARGPSPHILYPDCVPELPEVETIVRGLDKRATGDTIESVWIGSRKQPLKSPAGVIASTLEGKRIVRVHRAGKHIAVSYTHLDVYKRQFWMWAAAQARIRWRTHLRFC